jgi:hypothetical protein
MPNKELAAIVPHQKAIKAFLMIPEGWNGWRAQRLDEESQTRASILKENDILNIFGLGKFAVDKIQNTCTNAVCDYYWLYLREVNP